MPVKFDVNTLGFLVSCRKLDGGLKVTAESCAKCPMHQGIIEIWPGEEITEKGKRPRRQHVKRDITELSLEPFEQSKLRRYVFVCGLPVRIEAEAYATLEEGDK